MMNRIDRSRRIGRMVDWTSAGLAKRRGLPIIVGILLVTAALVLQIIAYGANSRALDIAATLTHSIGVLFALIGLVMATPLGK